MFYELLRKLCTKLIAQHSEANVALKNQFNGQFDSDDKPLRGRWVDWTRGGLSSLAVHRESRARLWCGKLSVTFFCD